MLPTHKAVRDLLAGATRRSVTVGRAQPFAPDPGAGATFGVYVDDRMRTLAVVACDVPMSVLTGAAVATVPVGGVESELADRSPSVRTTEALRGVLAELAALLRPAGGAEAVLHAIYPPGVAPPSDLVTYVRTVGQRLDLEVSISGYGRGVMSLVCPAV